MPTAPTCPNCGKEMTLKRGKFGKFWGCSDYPECKAILPVSTGTACPIKGCNGALTEKTSRRGKVFYSCSNYPQCKFATWHKPTGEQCPDCGKYSLAEKLATRTGSITKVCINEDCPGAAAISARQAAKSKKAPTKTAFAKTTPTKVPATKGVSAKTSGVKTKSAKTTGTKKAMAGGNDDAAAKTPKAAHQRKKAEK